MTTIGIVVDHPKRDLTGCVKLAYELAKLGVRSYLMPLYAQGIEAPLLGLNGIISNNARPHYMPLFAGLTQLGIKIYVLDTEGGVLPLEGPASPEGTAETVSKTTGRFISGYAFWGENMRKAFAERQVLAEQRLMVTGCPRYDVTSAPWRGMLQYPEKNFILINTNFPSVNPLVRSTGTDDGKALASLGFDQGVINNRAEAARFVFGRLMEEIDYVCKALPDERFILRPHPFESAEVYRERFAAYKNLVVDDTGEVFPVLAHAKALLHLNCSTAIESCMLGVVPISPVYANHNFLHAWNSLPTAVSHCVNSRDDLVAALKNPPVFNFADVYEKHIAPWFSAADGNAATRLAHILAGWLKEDSVPVAPSLLASLKGGHAPASAGQVAQGLFANVVGSQLWFKVRAARDPGKRAKYFDAAVIQNVIDALAKAEGTSAPVTAVVARHPYFGHRLLSIEIKAR